MRKGVFLIIGVVLAIIGFFFYNMGTGYACMFNSMIDYNYAKFCSNTAMFGLFLMLGGLIAGAYGAYTFLPKESEETKPLKLIVPEKKALPKPIKPSRNKGYSETNLKELDQAEK